MQTFSLKCLVVLKRLLYYLNKKYGIPCPRNNSSWHTQKKIRLLSQATEPKVPITRCSIMSYSNQSLSNKGFHKIISSSVYGNLCKTFILIIPQAIISIIIKIDSYTFQSFGVFSIVPTEITIGLSGAIPKFILAIFTTKCLLIGLLDKSFMTSGALNFSADLC